MKKTVLASIAAIMMIACGDDSGNNTNSQNESSQAYKVPTIYELGTCSAQNNGQSILVESESAYYICSNNEWKRGSEADFDEYGNTSSSSLATFSSNSEDMTPPPCETCEYGSLTDDRDGQVYRTVKIGDQWWMAENLNYKTETGSACYENSDENCVKYGKLYTLDASLKACPKDWHLPTKEEFTILCRTAGGYDSAGKRLKSKNDWVYDGFGLDTFGFSALPAGAKGEDGFYQMGKRTWFRMQSESVATFEWGLDTCDLEGAPNSNAGGSIRCIKD